MGYFLSTLTNQLQFDLKPKSQIVPENLLSEAPTCVSRTLMGFAVGGVLGSLESFPKTIASSYCRRKTYVHLRFVTLLAALGVWPMLLSYSGTLNSPGFCRLLMFLV